MIHKKMKESVQKIYDAKLVAPEVAAQAVKSGDCVYYGTNVTTAFGFDNILARRENELEDVTVCGASCFKPNGLLSPDSKAFHPLTYYFGTYERKAQKKKFIDYTSMHLSETNQFILNVAKPNVAIIPVSAPDENGLCSFGPAGIVCGPSLMQICDTIIFVINDRLPYMISKPEFMGDISKATYIVEMPDDPVTVPLMEPSEALNQICSFISDQIHDGDCIQMGIGDLSTAVGRGLTTKNDLGVHSEMIGDTMMDLIRAGNVTNRNKAYMPGKSLGVFLMGTQELYDWADWNDDLIFMPPDIGNSPLTIAKNDNVRSINTVLEMDLVGQAVADNIQGRQYSSVGGQLDYVNGSQLSKGGKSFIAFTSTHTKNGKVYSNIVSRLKPGTFVTTPRNCVQYVVTEYGCVNLKALSMKDRVLAMISLAHPMFRDELKDQAKEYGLLP